MKNLHFEIEIPLQINTKRNVLSENFHLLSLKFISRIISFQLKDYISFICILNNYNYVPIIYIS